MPIENTTHVESRDATTSGKFLIPKYLHNGLAGAASGGEEPHRVGILLFTNNGTVTAVDTVHPVGFRWWDVLEQHRCHLVLSLSTDEYP